MITSLNLQGVIKDTVKEIQDEHYDSPRFRINRTEGEERVEHARALSSVSIKDTDGKQWYIPVHKSDQLWNKPTASPQEMYKYLSPVNQEGLNYIPSSTSSMLEYISVHQAYSLPTFPNKNGQFAGPKKPRWGKTFIPKVNKVKTKPIKQAYFDWKTVEALRQYSILVEGYMRGETLPANTDKGVEDVFLKVFQLQNNHTLASKGRL